MSHPILVTGAAGGAQGSTGRVITMLLLEQGISVRAFVHKIDSRSDELRQHGAEVVEGDLLKPASVQAAMKDVKRAYFTYPVADGLLEAATIFAAMARDAGLELVVNNSQFQGSPDDPAFRDLKNVPSFRNLQHRLADRIFDWAQVGGRSSSGASLLRKCARSCEPKRGRAEYGLSAVGRWRRCHSARRRRRCSPRGCNTFGRLQAAHPKGLPAGERNFNGARDYQDSWQSVGTANPLCAHYRRAVGRRR